MPNWKEVQEHWNKNVFLKAVDILAHFGVQNPENKSRHGVLQSNGVFCPRKKGNRFYDSKKKEVAEFWEKNKNLSAKQVGEHFGTSESMIRGICKSPTRYHSQKLTEAQVKEIRSRNGEPLRNLAKEFGVSTTTIHQIMVKKVFKSIS